METIGKIRAVSSVGLFLRLMGSGHSGCGLNFGMLVEGLG